MKKEGQVLAQLTDEDLARIDALATERGISREEMLREVIRSGVDVLEGPRSGVKGPGEGQGA
jgi:hypothetical protein